MKHARVVIYLWVVLALLSACGPGASASGAGSVTPLPTLVKSTPVPSQTVTSTSAPPTATPSPSLTATSAPTATASLTVTLTPPLSATGVPPTVQALLNGATPTPFLLPTSVSENPAQTATPAATPEKQQTLFDEYLPRAEKVGETDHFIYYAQDGYFPVNQADWEQQSEEIYAYVSQRLGADVKHKIEVAFQPFQQQVCQIRGLASEGDVPMIIIFADPTSSLAYLQAVLAHEVGHAIPWDGFPAASPMIYP